MRSGRSVPQGYDSSSASLRYLSIEQNLADGAALVQHLKALYPEAAHVVTQGGSYAGASSAWMRHAYPQLIDAAVAQAKGGASRKTRGPY